MCRRRRTSPAQPASASITASSSRIGNKTGCFCRRSFSSAVSTSLHTHSLATECAERTRSSLLWTRMLIGGLCKKTPYCKRPKGGGRGCGWRALGCGCPLLQRPPRAKALAVQPWAGGRQRLVVAFAALRRPRCRDPWVSSPARACLLPAHPGTGRPRVLATKLRAVLAPGCESGAKGGRPGSSTPQRINMCVQTGRTGRTRPPPARGKLRAGVQ